MTENEIQTLKTLNNIIENLINGQPSIYELKTLPSNVSEPLKDLTKNLVQFAQSCEERQDFILALANGKLDILPPKNNNFIAPFKQLHSDLLHLVWQTKEIAEGDYNQKVSFMGDFSIAFNKLIESLKEKKKIEANLIKSNATKDKFFSIIAHDLKNPFNVLMGFSELLLNNYDNYDDNKKKNLIALIYEKSNITFKLLEDLLLWAHSQKKQIVFNPENFILKLLVDENISLISSSAEKKGINIESYVNDELVIYSDKSIITTILRNFMSNAIKFTYPNGTVKVFAKKITKANSKNYIEITVVDTGVGITPENLINLFKIEKTSSTVGTENEKGTGLGLILCKELVEICGGNIWVESEIGKGSSFKFTFPNQNADE